MVNTNIQGPIPLDGQGLTYKPSGNYGKGEFPEFQNLEWDDDTIRTRRPIYPIQDGVSPFGYGYQNLSSGFIGEDAGAVAAVSPTDNWIIGGYGRKYYKTAWSPTLLPDPVSPDAASPTMISEHFIVGFVRYNNVPYWITQKVKNNSVNELWIFKGNTGFQYSSVTTLPATSVKIADLSGFYINQFRRVFVHKDRIFIVTDNRVFFSKATDPLTWAVPDGGFIGVEQGKINDAVGLNDTIFITSTYKTYVYTYSTDPNTDSLLRPIVSGTELGPLVVSGNDVYTASSSNIYQIANNGLKLLKNLDDVTAPMYLRKVVKLAILGDTMYILRGKQDAGFNGNSRNFITPLFLTTDLLTMNMINGMMGSIEFMDNLDLATSGSNLFNRGIITDIYTPSPVGQDIPAIYFAVSHDPDGSATVFRTRFYYMNESRNTPADTADVIERPASNSGMDRIVKSNATTAKTRIEIKLRLENFAPDGSEYLQKRFRSLLLEGLLPNDTGTKLDVLFDGTSVALSEDGTVGPTGPNRVQPYAYRLKVNQKSKTLGIYIYTQNFATLDPAPNAILDINSPYFFYLTDMRTLWNYTQDIT